MTSFACLCFCSVLGKRRGKKRDMTKTSESIQQPLHEWLLATHMFPAHQRRKDVPRLSYSLSMTNILIPFIPLQCSTCCTVISVWGILFLFVMGALFDMQARALIADAPPDPDTHKITADGMRKAAGICYGSGGIYVGTFLLSVWQMQRNSKESARKAMALYAEQG